MEVAKLHNLICFKRKKIKRENRYGIKSLEKDFTTDEDCLEFIFDAQHSRKCSCGGSFKIRENRKQYQCSKCRLAISPLAGTIFEKSLVPLKDWFQSMLDLHNGISILALSKKLKVGYKTAFRIKKVLTAVWVSDTITICKIEQKKEKNIAKNIKKNFGRIKKNGNSKTGKQKMSIVENTDLNTLKNTETGIEKIAKNCDLKLFLNTQKEYQNALAVEKEKSNFWRLTT